MKTKKLYKLLTKYNEVYAYGTALLNVRRFFYTNNDLVLENKETNYLLNQLFNPAYLLQIEMNFTKKIAYLLQENTETKQITIDMRQILVNGRKTIDFIQQQELLSNETQRKLTNYLRLLQSFQTKKLIACDLWRYETEITFTFNNVLYQFCIFYSHILKTKVLIDKQTILNRLTNMNLLTNNFDYMAQIYEKYILRVEKYYDFLEEEAYAAITPIAQSLIKQQSKSKANLNIETVNESQLKQYLKNEDVTKILTYQNAKSAKTTNNQAAQLSWWRQTLPYFMASIWLTNSVPEYQFSQYEYDSDLNLITNSWYLVELDFLDCLNPETSDSSPVKLIYTLLSTPNEVLSKNEIRQKQQLLAIKNLSGIFACGFYFQYVNALQFIDNDQQLKEVESLYHCQITQSVPIKLTTKQSNLLSHLQPIVSYQQKQDINSQFNEIKNQYEAINEEKPKTKLTDLLQPLHKKNDEPELHVINDFIDK